MGLVSSQEMEQETIVPPRVQSQRGDPYLHTTISAGTRLGGRAGDKDKK